MGSLASRMVWFVRMRYERALRSMGLFKSGSYWSERYRKGGNSGAGSYGKLAQYKADFLNNFAREHGTRSVIEFGCGDGNQAQQFEFEEYTGVDVTHEAVAMCREQHGHRPGWKFHQLGETEAYAGAYDLVLSLDVVYHLIEDTVYHDYMSALFDHARDNVLIYASDRDENAFSAHVRHRKHSEWVAANRHMWKMQQAHDNPLAGDGEDRTFAFFTHYVREPS